MSEKKEQIDRLTPLGISSPQLSQAKAIDSLSSPVGKANKVLSSLKTKDIPRLQLIFSLSRATGWQFLEEMGNDELAMRCSTSRKGVNGRDDVRYVAVPPQNQQQGALASFKEKIESFFRST